MVRVLESRIIVDGVNYCKFAGLHADSKPKAGVCTGSEFLEVDTGDVYAYDEAGSGTWTKIAAGYVAPST